MAFKLEKIAAPAPTRTRNSKAWTADEIKAFGEAADALISGEMLRTTHTSEASAVQPKVKTTKNGKVVETIGQSPAEKEIRKEMGKLQAIIASKGSKAKTQYRLTENVGHVALDTTDSK